MTAPSGSPIVPPRNPRAARRRRLRRAVIPLFTVLTIAGVSTLVWQDWKKANEKWRARLSAVADERAKLIEGWLRERRADAQVVVQYPSVLEILGDRGGGESPDTSHPVEEHLAPILRNVVRQYDYLGIAIVGSEGDLLLREGEDGPSDAALIEHARSTVATRRPSTDHLSRDDDHYLLFGTPVFEMPSSPESRVLGSLEIVVDPTRSLWPMITKESVPTKSGETMLMVRRGGEAVSISPVRFFSGDEPLRVALGDAPSQQAALFGEERSGTFVDYRGVPVLAATRMIDGAPWGLVQKIDREEAFAEFRRDAWFTGLLGFVAAGVFGALLLGTSWLQRAEAAEAQVAHERALRAARDRYRLLSEDARDIILFLTRDGRIVEANAAAERAYGRSREELRGLRGSELRPPELRSDFAGQLGMGIETREVYETTHCRADGTRFTVEVSATVTEVEDEPLILAILRDVSERKRHEERIRHLGGVLNATREISGMLVRETDRARVREQACEILLRLRTYALVWIGVPSREGKGVVPVACAGGERGHLERAVSRLSAEDDCRGPCEIALRTRRPCIIRSIARDDRAAAWRGLARELGLKSAVGVPILHDGEVYGALNVFASRDDVFDSEEVDLLCDLAADLGFALRAIDLRAERGRAEERYRLLAEELERRVEERTKDLRELNRELESFNYSVSHDLRAPLRHIEGFIRLLEEDYGETLPPEARRYLQRISTGSRRMGALIDGLLRLSRVGRAEVRLEPVDLGALVRSCFDEQRPSEKEIELVVGPFPPVIGDAALLRQLFDNLLGNALKFTRTTSTPRIEVGSEQKNGSDVFYVRDNGVGFDSACSSELFGDFQRLHTDQRFEGTGIGLSIVRRIVEKHGGSVWAEGREGEGATFYFTLGSNGWQVARPVA